MLPIEDIIKEGVQKGASDIHLVFDSKPVLRINRDLISLDKYEIITKSDMEDVLDYFLKDNEGKRSIMKKDRMLDLHYEIFGVRIRVNISMSEETPVFTMRIIKNVLPNFYTLGLPEIIKKIAMQPQGLILVTGKPNTGKSTTLNAMVNEINKTENRKILMLESPIEYTHKSNKSLIIQKEVGEGRDCPTYHDGARNALREDCDILVVGEIRDKETMDALIEMAESGHLVIGTLHTKNCAETIDRLVSFYDKSEQNAIKFIVSTLLKLVVSQRLIKGVNDKLVLVPEIMVVDNVIGALIRREKFAISEIEDAIQTRTSIGNCSFMISLADLVIKDRITLEQAQAQLDDKNKDLLIKTIAQRKMRV